MKNYSLSLQIWVVIAIISLVISGMLTFILPNTLRDFFTKEIYATIRSAQDLVFNQFEGEIYRDYIGPDFFGTNKERMDNIRVVNHFIIYDNNKLVLDSSLPLDFVQKVKDEASSQTSSSREYVGYIQDDKVFYIISQGKALGYDAFFVSYMGDSYRDDLVKTLFSKLISILVFILLFSWIPAILLSRYISRPLVDLERRVERLANNDWTQPVGLNRKDEIGRLGHSIEHLRKQLIRQDEAEQSFLQHVSHELKTPVMVIQSYTEAIKDGIYPKGNLYESLDIISEETSRLEKKIRNLLYLTKLNYLSNHQIEMEDFYLDILVQKVAEKFSWSQSIEWTFDLDTCLIRGNLEQWRIVLENLFENQIRYGLSQIKVGIKEGNLNIWNDGDHIDLDVLESMFDPYAKGVDGDFGLGLNIVKEILKNHGWLIAASNEEVGVSFHIKKAY